MDNVSNTIRSLSFSANIILFPGICKGKSLFLYRHRAFQVDEGLQRLMAATLPLDADVAGVLLGERTDDDHQAAVRIVVLNLFLT